MDTLKLADHSWSLLSRIMGLQVRAYRLTGGRIGGRIPGIAAPVLLLDHVGARSGVKRTSALLYVEDGDDVVIVASKGGYERHPAWYHNLRANPETTVQIGSERRPVRARVASAEERPRLWEKAVAAYSGYRGYQERTEREIPLVVLSRR
ncbi:MAG TPA: nitroreductase family deazaflavin-dependent oxidoreductase [Solirubrobacteraceae bacterium]|nr:nitroreductase family deazaflavin-dependent oxidoreductase [Solirubrobacteraceae bacterium]